MSAERNELDVATSLISSDGAREAEPEFQMQDPNLVIPTSLSHKHMSNTSTVQEASVGQSILDHSLSQDTMVIDAHMSGMLPSSQAGHTLPVQQEGTAMQTYTDEKGNIYRADEKGNIYQGEMGQGDAAALVQAATPQTIPPPPPRGLTQYIVSQVDDHGRKHQFIIQTGESGELTTQQLQQIIMSQGAFTQQPITVQAQNVEAKTYENQQLEMQRKVHAELVEKQQNKLMEQLKANQEQQKKLAEQRETELLRQQKVVLEQQVQQETAKINNLLLKKRAMSTTGAKRGKGGKRVPQPTVTTASAIIQQLTSPTVTTETLLPQQMLASQRMQEALKVLQQDQTTRVDSSQIQVKPDIQSAQIQHVPALLKKRKRSSADVMGLHPQQVQSVVDLPVTMAATTASPLATGLVTSSTASEILKYLERDTSGLSSKSMTSNHNVAMVAKRDADKPVARVEVLSTEPGAQASEALLHVEISEDPISEEKVYQRELEENAQNQEPFVPPPVAVMVQREPSPDPNVEEEPAPVPVPSHIIPGAPPNPDYDDRYQWCNDCGKSVKALCKKHGDLAKVKDRFIPSRAKLTTPHQLVVKTIELRAAGNHVFGVFAKKVIQNRTLFGPYEGEESESWNYGREDRLKLRLFKPEARVVYLDCTNQNACNWMMFVRCARSLDEQNLAAYQHNGKVYFVTIKPISQNEELRVWYAEHYAQALGEHLLGSNIVSEVQPQQTPKKVATAEEVGVFAGMEDETTQYIELFTEPDGGKKRSPRVVTNEANLNTAARDNEEVHTENNEGQRVVELLPEPAPEAEEDAAYEEVVVVKKRGRGRPKKIKEEELETEAVITLSIKEEGSPSTPPGEDSEDDIVTSQEQLDSRTDKADLSERESSEERGRRSKDKRKRRPMKRKRGRPPSRRAAQKVVDEENENVEPEEEEEEEEEFKEPVVKKRKGRPTKSSRMMLKPVEGKVIKRKLKKPKTLYHCDECDKAYLTQNKLQEHKFIHSGEKPFKCTAKDCEKAFSSKFKLIRHELIHQGEKKHMCPYCQKSFTRKDHLKNHLKVHDPNKTVHMCPKCSKEYASSFAFRTHMAIHAANEGELMCGVCKAEFTEKPKLIAHLKIHAGARSIKDSEKNQKCPFCNKMFFTRKDVKRHLVVHTKDRDFLCQYCPQRFGRRDHLVRHLKKAHANEAAADGFKGVLPDTSPIKESTLGGVKSKGKRASGLQAPGPSEESIDRRLEGHASMVSELLQSVAVNMANELPAITNVKSEAQNVAPKKQQVQQQQQQQLSQQLQQVVLQSSPTHSGTAQYVTIPIAGQGKTVPIQFNLGGQQVQGVSSSGFVPPILPATVVQAAEQQTQQQTNEQSQHQQVAASMIKLGQNYVQIVDQKTVPGTATAGGSDATLNVPIQQGTIVSGALVPGPPVAGVVATTANNATVNAVLDLFASSEERDAAQKLTLLSNAASLPQEQIQQGHLVSYNDAIKLANLGQFTDSTGTQGQN